MFIQGTVELSATSTTWSPRVLGVCDYFDVIYNLNLNDINRQNKNTFTLRHFLVQLKVPNHTYPNRSSTASKPVITANNWANDTVNGFHSIEVALPAHSST